MPIQSDIDLSAKDVGGLSSPDAIAGFFNRLGYPTGCRKELTAGSLGLTGDTAQAVTSVELIAADPDDFFRVVFASVRSITAKTRNELARKLGQSNIDHLIVLASNFEWLEFVLVDKRTRQHRGPGGGGTVQVIPRTIAVNRKGNTPLDRRILRRLTWTGHDALDQFAKLRSVFESAAFTSQYFQNRALFADHYLEHRLREDSAWRDNPTSAFTATKSCMADARNRWTGKPEQSIRDELFNPLWSMLGFKAKVNKASSKDHPQPDYILQAANGDPATVAFVYRWDRWLDGPDFTDPDTPEENPGAAVVSALNDENTRWAIVTNGKLWRLYSRDAHSRSTNFYEVDLEEALIASDETDPNEAFRYWWLFFRADAFKPIGDDKRCWLDTIVLGSRDYAKRLGDRLKDHVFLDIFPHLADGFLADRKHRLGEKSQPSDAELSDTFQATLTLLYRLLFLLYAEARDLLPIRESPYEQASLKRIKEEIAEHAGKAESNVSDQLNKAYDRTGTKLYDRLSRLFAVMDKGDTMLNVPCYNGGLFITDPKKLDDREHRIARFLADHKVPDLYLALAIDRLSRDVDDKTLGLVFIDYKSLEVRHLGSIYEGLLEFKLKIAEEDLTTTTEKKKEKYIPLSQAKPGRGKSRRAGIGITVRKGEVYLSNDKAERKATGSYYTPDPIVEYIVEHTVGPVLREKLDGLRDDFRDAAKTFHRHIGNTKSNPGLLPTGSDSRTFAGEKTYAEHKTLVDRLFDFKVLDPAMGSGHFLVEAVDFITDTLLDFLNRFPNNPVAFALERTRSSILEALGQQGVTVDANKLTGVNLLKRHVLKRCIYGVDLNPMAVELAKVSLWLDAFTLGAPLSFLDHHLRCGNSLIGATFKGLETATQGQLFSIDYQPLLDAICNVLFVNAMSDATTAEVHESVRRYGDARRALSGYKIVLDLLTGDYFSQSLGLESKSWKTLHPTLTKPSQIIRHAASLDLTTNESFRRSLKDTEEQRLVVAVEQLADRPDRRFFHWEIEFPEVFFAFEDPDQRRVKHRNEIVPGSAGFDAVIGNPPYVNANELNKTLPPGTKDFWKAGFASAKGTYDAYVIFLELCLRLSASNGRSALITPNKFLAAPYGVALRDHILRNATIERFYDASRVSVFDDPSVYPVITCLSKRRIGTPYKIVVDQCQGSLDRVTSFQHKSELLSQLPEYLWGFLFSDCIEVLRRVIRQCVPLNAVCVVNASSTASESDAYTGIIQEKEQVNRQPHWPIVNTGLIDRFHLKWGEIPMQHSGYQISKPVLIHDSAVVSQTRAEQYNSPKLIFAKVASRIESAFDEHGAFAAVNVNFAFCHGDPAYFYLGLLNSTLLTWVYGQYFGALRMSGGYFQFQAPQLRVLPVPDFRKVDGVPTTSRIISLAREAANAPDRVDVLSQEIDQLVYALFDLDAADVAKVQRTFQNPQEPIVESDATNGLT